MATIRAYKGDERISTAVILKDGEILQVFPPERRSKFASEEEWRAAWPDADRFEHKAAPPPKPKKYSRSMTLRRDNELMEFFHDDYSSLFQSLTIVRNEKGRPMISAVLAKDGSSWTVYRSENPFKPPRIMKDGKEIPEYNKQFSPALTAVRWLMMLAFVEPTES